MSRDFLCRTLIGWLSLIKCSKVPEDLINLELESARSMSDLDLSVFLVVVFIY